MLSNLKKYQLILASNSPRRKELMSGLGVEYVVRTLPDVDESYPETLVGAESEYPLDGAILHEHPSGLSGFYPGAVLWLSGQVLP